MCYRVAARNKWVFRKSRHVAVPPPDATAYHPIALIHSGPEGSMLLRRSLKYMFQPRPQVRIVRDPPPGQPLVSVIIATYNWSTVLRMAIHSVLWQTGQNFELLVIGDGCTDDSEDVVRSFGDARIHWHNLPVNSGNQS